MHTVLATAHRLQYPEGSCGTATMYGTLTCMSCVAPSCVYRFHWVIILAGVNDIGWGAGAEEIFHGLRRMYHVSMSV